MRRLWPGGANQHEGKRARISGAFRQRSQAGRLGWAPYQRERLMLRRKWAVGVVLLVVCGLASCGGSKKTTTTTPDTGPVAIFIGDSPLCDVLSFRGAVQGVTFKSQDGSLNSTPFATIPFINVNFAGLRDTTTILQFGKIDVGTYDQVEIELSLPQFALFDPSVSPPVTYISNPSSDSKATYSIEPPLTVTKDALSGVRIDLDIRHSISVDAQGQVTGVGSPAFTASAITPTDTNGFGTLEALRGFVLSINNSSTSSDFVGSFSIQLLSGTANVPVLNVSLTPDTELIGTSALNQLPGGSYVEVNGYVDSQGNLVARTVDVEDQENVSQNRMALIGTITSITRDTNGNPTQFGLFVSEEQPEFAAGLPLERIYTVNLSSSTRYQISSHSVNFASLPFDPTALETGQGVVVHGPFTKASDGTVTIAANSVYLRLQTHEGNFVSLVSAGSDDRTGAFWMAPCGTLLQGQSFLVLTNNQTQFVNVPGLSGLTVQPSLLLKGLLFFDGQGGTVSGVSVPAQTPVFVVNQVHQLP